MGESTRNALREPIAGSALPAIVGASASGTVDPNEEITVTMVLRRRAELPEELVVGVSRITAQELADRYGASPADVEAVRTAVTSAGAEVGEVHVGARLIQVHGSAGTLSKLFGAELQQFSEVNSATGKQSSYRYRSGGLSVPGELSGVVLAVLGLDNRPSLRRVSPRSTPATALDAPQPVPAAALDDPDPSASAAGTTSSLFWPPQLAAVYDFPVDYTGAGQTIAILEYGGGYLESDLQAFFSRLDIAPPSIKVVSVGGAPANDPNNSPDANGEVTEDISIAAGMAPGADYVMYWGGNDNQGMLNTISAAIHASPTPTAISQSWGDAESTYGSDHSLGAINEALRDGAALGVTFCNASGDTGSYNPTSGSGTADPAIVKTQANVLFPASSPYALSCGATTLFADLTTNTANTETVWNLLGLERIQTGSIVTDGVSNNGTRNVPLATGTSGGGISAYFPTPQWQKHVELPEALGGKHRSGRGCPDVSGPGMGYLMIQDGVVTWGGGTSAVGPVWSALLARLAQALGRPFGLLQPLVYPTVAGQTAYPGFRGIVEGTNFAYNANPGWNACTGLGVPQGTALLNHLAQVLKKTKA